MLVTDPKQRANMQDVMCHPWMAKGYNAPPESFLPLREPLQLPLDQEVINSMTGFNFGSPESIKMQLTKVVESEEYSRAVSLHSRERDQPQPPRDIEKRRVLGFYKRRNSSNSRDNLTMPSTEGLQLGSDPLNAFHPLISIYYLVREKQERDRVDVPPPSPQPTHGRIDQFQSRTPVLGSGPNEENQTMAKRFIAQGPDRLSELHNPPPANDTPIETSPQGASPPAALLRERDIISAKGPEPGPQFHAVSPPSDLSVQPGPKDKNGPVGLLRRFSTRRKTEKDRSNPPAVQIHSPVESSAPRKSFSIRHSRRDRDEDLGTRVRSGSTQPQPSDHLSPPLPSVGSRSKGLGRSTSVNSAEMRRPGFTHTSGKRELLEDITPSVPNDGVGDGGATDGTPIDNPPLSPSPNQPSRSASMRAKTLGHARRESIQIRRLRREGARDTNLAEEVEHGPGDTVDHDHGTVYLEGDQGDQSGLSTEKLDDGELAKPVFLKGLFSVSTTSPKSVPEIRAEIRRVLVQQNVEYNEIKGGFSCRHTPPVEITKVAESMPSPPTSSNHRRRFSFGALRSPAALDRDHDSRGDNDAPKLNLFSRSPMKMSVSGDRPEHHSNSSMESISGDADASEPRRRVPGETTTQVHSDLGGSMVVEFEIFIVKVPLFSLHGIQFKRMVGNTWQFKNMADGILRQLRL
jgi:hypothetical protein